MTSGAVYPAWDYSTGYDDRHPEYVPYTSARTFQQYPQPHQVWRPSSQLSYDSYQESPHMRHSSIPSNPASPPSLRHLLVDDPAFSPDPNTNPDNWFAQRDMLSATPFPSTRSHSSSDLPPGFVPQSGPVPNLPGRSHSYHEDTREPPSVPRSVYYVPPSVLSSSSDSSASGSSARTPSVPRSTVRSSDKVYELPPDSTFRSNSGTDAMAKFSDEGQSRPSNTKHRPKRRSAHAAEPPNDHPEVSGAVVLSVEHTAAHEDRIFRNVTSSVTSSSAPPPPGLSEPSKDGRARTSSRVNLADLDSIDELDETNPYGINIHHRGPYEAVAAILNETNPIDSPLMRIKGIQQQVSAGSPLRPSRKIQSEPNANPMSLNLKPGQILQGSIYQPMRPSHHPHERSLATYPSDHYIRPSHAPTELSRAEHDAASVGSPLRRIQTLPVASSARGPLEQSHHISQPVRPELQTYKSSYPVDPSTYQPQPPPLGSQNSAHQPQMSRSRYTSETPSNSMPPQPYPQRTGSDHGVRRRSSYADPIYNTQLSSESASMTSAFPTEPPPSPDLELRLSRTLYLTNPDQTADTPNSRALPSAPEVIYPSRELRSEPSSRIRADSFYGPQPLRAPAPTETSRRSPPRSSPPASSTGSRQEMPRRYEPPSQTLAAVRVGHPASVTSGSSSNHAPRHVPRRLVMPTPLATTAENTGRPRVSSRVNDGGPGRPAQLLRKRSVSAVIPPPQRPSQPPQTVNRGMLSFFGFGKGSKPTVHQVRVTEPSKHMISEMQQLQVRGHPESRKLSKRK